MSQNTACTTNTARILRHKGQNKSLFLGPAARIQLYGMHVKASRAAEHPHGAPCMVFTRTARAVLPRPAGPGSLTSTLSADPARIEAGQRVSARQQETRWEGPLWWGAYRDRTVLHQAQKPSRAARLSQCQRGQIASVDAIYSPAGLLRTRCPSRRLCVLGWYSHGCEGYSIRV